MSDEELRESLGLTTPSSDPCYGCSSLQCPGEGGCISYKKFHDIPLSEDEALLVRQYEIAYEAIKLGLFDHVGKTQGETKNGQGAS